MDVRRCHRWRGSRGSPSVNDHRHVRGGHAWSVLGVSSEHRGTETILLVEDDPSVLALTASALRELGYSVFEARHGNDALEVLKSGPAPDLMLTDVVMPEMNGRSLAEQANELRPDMKVLFMTGFTKNAIVHNGVLDPGVQLLAKPFTIEELSAKVREVLGTKTHVSTS